jgi:hypothetical protein
MTHEIPKFPMTELQWLKIHLRMAALEHGGSRLKYRFEFPGELSISFACAVYFTDDESNSIAGISGDDRLEIYEGWVSLGMQIIRRAVEAADLSANFQWNPVVRFELFEGYGMGSSLVRTIERSFRWPEIAEAV